MTISVPCGPGDQRLPVLVHDLRTPLTTILGSTQLLRRRSTGASALDRDQLTGYLGRIEEAAVRMARLLDELLDLEHLEAGRALPLNRQPTDLVDLARRAVEECRRDGDGGRTVTLAATAPRPVGLWDARRPERVLANLLDNAVKYSPDDGAIRVAVEQAGERVVLCVQDRGAGISAPELPRAFDPFYRASNVVGRFARTGLGLASARQIVEQHGGCIAVESREGAGTTIVVRLPLVGG